ncbi:hypothetical protein ACFFRL_04960 [Agromyces hippuratus]|uniref:hypothetical protein n=1 Tax=Agromyces hippuratus TaxID=286438 RepID=UPI0035ED9F2D
MPEYPIGAGVPGAGHWRRTPSQIGYSGAAAAVRRRGGGAAAGRRSCGARIWTLSEPRSARR